MGNSITKKFDVPKDHSATAGHHQFWKIWHGKSKETGEHVSIWAFDKADLSKRKVNPITDKAVLEQIFQIMKKDFTALKEASSCTSVVRYIETIEESKNTIVFTTERIICSLGDIFGHFQGIEGGSSSVADFFEDNGSVSEMEVSRGLLSLAEGLQYFHTVQRKLHLNITPESVVIAQSGQWKWCGFGFTLTFIQGDQQRLASPYFMKAAVSNVCRLEPDLRYCGPEVTDGGFNPPGIRYLTPATDVFALGILMYEAYKYNLRTILERGSHKPSIHLTNNDVMQHQYGLEGLKSLDFTILPPGVAALVVGLLQLNVNSRLSTSDIINNQYFVSGSLALVNMIENMAGRDIGTQSSQMISLQGQLGALSPRVLYLNVLPNICKLCIANPALWVYAIPLHVFLSQHIPSEKYKNYAGPTMAIGLAATVPTETMQAFLSNIQFVIHMFDRAYFLANVVTLFCNALEKQQILLQNLALEKLSDDEIRSAFDMESLQDRLMPKLCKEACRNPEPNIKMQALYVLSLFTSKLDQPFIAKNILPSLKYITDNEKNASVSMCVIGNYEALSESLGPEYIANSILPSILPMLVDKSLDKQQFEVVVNLVKTLMKKLFDGRTRELGMKEISVGEMLGNTHVDPFSAAKNLISVTRRNNAAVALGNNPVAGPSYSTVTPTLTPSSISSSAGPPPPLPSSAAPSHAPPPPPSGPPPALPGSAPPSVVPSSFAAPAPAASTNAGGLFAGIATTSSSASSYTSPISSYQSGFDSNKTGTGGGAAAAAAPDNFLNPFASGGATLEPLGNTVKPTPAVAPAAPAAAPAAASSGFGWFTSSSKSNTSTAAPKVEEYKPPVAAAVAPTSAGGQIDDMDDFLSSFGKSNTTVASTPSTMNSFATPASSYKAPAVPAAAAATAPTAPASSTLGFPPAHAASSGAGGSALSIEEQIRQTQEQIAKLQGGGGGAGMGMSMGMGGLPAASPVLSPTTSTQSGGMYATKPAANSGLGGMSTTPLQPQNAGISSYNAPTASGSSLQSMNANSFSLSAAPTAPVATASAAAPQSAYGQQSQSMGGLSAMGMGGMQQPQQQYPSYGQQQQPQGQYGQPQYGQPQQGYGQQGYGMQQQPQQQYNAGFSNVNPQAQGAAGAGGISGYSSQSYNMHHQQQNPGMYQQQQNQQWGGGMNANRIGNLPPATGYQPPNAYQPPQTQQYQQPQQYGQQQYGQQYQQQQQKQQQQQQQNKGSAFDFLN